MAPVARPIDGRFWGKVEKTETCWLWKASCFHDGYGMFKDAGKNKRAHRVAWLLAHGSIDQDLLVCHSCDVPRCVRPDHLFQGTASDNARDCVKKKRQRNSRKTHCPKGHPYSDENTRMYREGTRDCGECLRTKVRLANRKRRLEHPEQMKAYMREWKLKHKQDQDRRAKQYAV